ncbi:hypothetical protein BSP36_154 [Bacillus phage BSP36]|uniref:Uncharacterized protein n=1 Tax=Bacillus phage BSP38 TaxID=2283013 RepID=A0A345MK18_BPBSP|nr:hypothetical protein HWB82_gp160 [Bacillus phage BSP38]AXH71200.1 hypothetical protein BSP38_158 [Bacillus phage BSP38]AYJ75241.1 hypothetical protein BSP36_154 [Bacillus phage BSP36]
MADKKDIKKKSISSSSVLVQLYNNRKLATKVDNMLDEGQTYDYIIDFCKENGLSISKASLTNYKKKREEAIRTGKPLLQLLDKRAKDNVTYISDKEVQAFKERKAEKETSGEPKGTVTNLSKVDSIYHDIELLDEIIQKGAKGLRQFDVVDTPLAMKAIELKAKITNNQLSGLSIAGLRELKLRQQARESALTEVIMKYVPEEQHDSLFADMEEAQQRFYENLDLSDEDRRISQALKQSGIDL